MNNKVYKAVKWLLVIVVLVLSALLIYHVVRIKMIPNKYIIIISAILVLVNLVNILFTKSKKILLNIVAFIIGIFMISGAGLGIYYTNGTYGHSPRLPTRQPSGPMASRPFIMD